MIPPVAVINQGLYSRRVLCRFTLPSLRVVASTRYFLRFIRVSTRVLDTRHLYRGSVFGSSRIDRGSLERGREGSRLFWFTIQVARTRVRWNACWKLTPRRENFQNYHLARLKFAKNLWNVHVRYRGDVVNCAKLHFSFVVYFFWAFAGPSTSLCVQDINRRLAPSWSWASSNFRRHIPDCESRINSRRSGSWTKICSLA